MSIQTEDFFFFFNDTATTEIYTLSLHDALPISEGADAGGRQVERGRRAKPTGADQDRKSTRLNSSHGYISYAVFCLKKKKRLTSTDTPGNPFPPPCVSHPSRVLVHALAHSYCV